MCLIRFADLAISATVMCGKEGEIGLLGADIYFSNLAEDVTYYSNYEDFTYAFIINTDGMHLYFYIYFSCVATIIDFVHCFVHIQG